ncbi:hypothetical protein ACLKA7_016470 [Drosophila subpalustris]
MKTSPWGAAPIEVQNLNQSQSGNRRRAADNLSSSTEFSGRSDHKLPQIAARLLPAPRPHPHPGSKCGARISCEILSREAFLISICICNAGYSDSDAQIDDLGPLIIATTPHNKTKQRFQPYLQLGIYTKRESEE